MGRNALQLAVAVVLAASATALGTMPVDERDPGHEKGVTHFERDGELHAGGRVKRLYPGAAKALRVRVRNASPRTVWLRSIKTRVGDAGPGCSRSHLEVRRKHRAHLRIRPDSRRIVRLRVLMRRSAPDACQGARWPLRFRVRAS
jgi:hypothetical protein